ncbi:MAG: hypothetical protein HYV55_01715 [Parcubacteria group bacterium]|nr:hypothetical protein [Parcubacteria group bacterium]
MRRFKGAIHFFGNNGFLRKNPLILEILALAVLFILIASAGSKNSFLGVRGAYPDFFAENAEFAVLEIPPSEAGFDKNVSSEVFSIIGPSILSQDVQSLIPTILLHYRIKYATFYDSTFVPLFEPFLTGETNAAQSPRIDKIDGAKLSRHKEQPFLSLGDGWYKNEEGDDGVYRWIERSAVIRFSVPEGKLDEASTILAFSAKHFPEQGSLDILLNDQTIETVSFSNKYSDMYVELKGLEEGDNNITFSSKDACGIAGRDDPRCISFAFKDIKLIPKKQIPEQGIIRYNGFYPEAGSEPGIRWMSTSADIQIFTLNPQRVFVSFDAVSYAKDRTFTVEQNKKKLQTITLHPGLTYEGVGFPFELQEGNNKLDLFSEGCDLPSLVEGNKDERCLSAQVKGFQYKALR